MRLVCLVFGAALWSAPLPAGAAGPSAACMDVEAEGLPGGLVNDLTRALRAALAEDGAFTAVEPKASLAEIRLLLDCQAATPVCWAAVARTVQARTLFVADVQTQGGGYRVRFRRIDGTTGNVTATAEATLTGTALARALHDQAADFFASLGGGVVRVLSEPSASEVLVDGQPRGTTPQSLKLRAGRHLIEVRHAGHRPHQQEIDVVVGGAVEIDARLMEIPRAVAVVERRPAGAKTRLRPATYATMAGAGLALVTGVVLGVLEHKTESEYNSLTLTHRADVDRRSRLESRGKNLSIGADVAFGVGGAALVVAGVLAYRDLRVRRETSPVRVTVAPGAIAVSWTY